MILHQCVPQPQTTSTLKPFRDAALALLQSPHVSALALINLWRGFLHHEEWLYNLSDQDFDWFITLWHDIRHSFDIEIDGVLTDA